MDQKVKYLTKSVEDTDRRLEDLTCKVERWERAVSHVSLLEEGLDDGQPPGEEEECLLGLLNDVTQVKEDYEQLRTDIVEIQQIQRELSHSLRNQLTQVHARYGFLRKRLGPSLPAGLQMNINSHQPSPLRQNSGKSHKNKP